MCVLMQWVWLFTAVYGILSFSISFSFNSAITLAKISIVAIKQANASSHEIEWLCPSAVAKN